MEMSAPWGLDRIQPRWHHEEEAGAYTLRGKKGDFTLPRGNVTKPKTRATNSSPLAEHTLPRDSKAQAKATSPAAAH